MIKKMTIPPGELKPGDYTIETTGYLVTIYREIPEYGTSAELDKAKETLSRVNLVAHRYFEQARELRDNEETRLAYQTEIHGERILSALRGEDMQNWPLPKTISVQPGNSATAWNAWLELALTVTLDDGTPVLRAVLEQNPELATRLDHVINKEKK